MCKFIIITLTKKTTTTLLIPRLLKLLNYFLLLIRIYERIACQWWRQVGGNLQHNICICMYVCIWCKEGNMGGWNSDMDLQSNAVKWFLHFSLNIFSQSSAHFYHHFFLYWWLSSIFFFKLLPNFSRKTKDEEKKEWFITIIITCSSENMHCTYVFYKPVWLRIHHQTLKNFMCRIVLHCWVF